MDELRLLDGVGDRLRSERVRLSMTQEELAARVGVQQQTIYKYERGHTVPPLAVVYALLPLGFNLQFLLFGRDHVPNPDDYPPAVFKVITEMISKIESAFSGGVFSDETKFRMMLILLNQHVKNPSSLPLTDTQALELLMGRK